MNKAVKDHVRRQDKDEEGTEGKVVRISGPGALGLPR